MIFCLDPGISAANATGVALLSPEGLVVHAGIIRRNAKLNDLHAQRDIAVRAVAWAGRPSVFATEWPQVYPDERKKDPNTAVLPLCGIIGAVNGLLDRDVRRIVYLPREWKGTIKGDVFLERIRARLTPAELAVLDAVMPAGLRHNATDAVGIGLKFMGRLDRIRVIHAE